MDNSSTTFKIRRSFNMSSQSPAISKGQICGFYSKYGFCKTDHKLVHQDCKNFFKYQYCYQKLANKCPYYHRAMCSTWKKLGKCFIPDCEFLHKNCENYQNYKMCKRDECPFYHYANEENLKKNNNIFVRKSSSIKITKKAAQTPFQPNFMHRENKISKTTIVHQNEKNEIISSPIKSQEEIIKKEEIEDNAPRRLIPGPFSDQFESDLSTRPLNFQVNSSNSFNEQNQHYSLKRSLEEIKNEEEEKNLSSSDSDEEEEKKDSFSPTINLSNRNISLSQSRTNLELSTNFEIQNHNFLRNNRRENTILQRLGSQNTNNNDTEERHGNLTIITLNRTNNTDEASLSVGRIGNTLDRINQFATHLRNIREALQNQEGDIQSLSMRFNSLRQIQERLSFVHRQERMINNLDHLLETFLLINALSNNPSFQQGLNLEEFEKLPIFVFGVDDYLKNDNNIDFKESSSRKTCSICLEDYKINDLVRRLYCGHQYHEECLREWTKKKVVCPICKQNIKQNPTNFS